ncbi:MAG: rod shape-determining protein [Prevotellaceae bacterium]|jgi:rod shape-determining protein MreB|nr:rod shape-determining protein [Prevotellaceae bacterium]
MAFSLLTQELAMDLGTANTLIISNDKIVVDEPSIVAIDKQTNKLKALGHAARQMQGREHEGIKVIRPLRDGVIADFDAAEMMIRGMIKMINNKNRWLQPTIKIVIGIPSGSTEVERRAVRDSAENAGGRGVYLIYEPMAAALGIGLDVMAPTGNMVIDIGGGTSEIAVISLGGIVCGESIRTAGDVFTNDIKEFMRQEYSVRIGERTAEDIKIAVGSALTELENPPADYIVRGPNIITNLPLEIAVSYQKIAMALDKSIARLETAIINVLEQMPPELYADVVANGIHLTGGGALLKGLDKRLKQKINISFIVSEDPLRAVARGTGLALKNVEKFPFLM